MIATVAALRIEEARRYCGKTGDAWRACGDAQLAILRAAGCQPTDDVLEVGAGALSGTRALAEYLAPGKLVAIEPHRWLVDAALCDPDTARLMAERRVRFLFRDDFDASETERTFAFALSHSVLAHAAHWQAAQMLTALRRVLAPGADLVASLRLRERPSYDTEWQYPGNSWFSLGAIVDIAHGCGFAVNPRPEWQGIMTAACPTSVHDWLSFRRLP